MKRDEASKPRPHGAVHIWEDGILFLGGGIRNDPHRHFTASLIFAFDGAFAFRRERSRWQTMRAVAVAPNVAQQIDTRASQVAILQIDPETEAYGRLARVFAQRGDVFEPGAAIVDEVALAARAATGAGEVDPAQLWTLALERVAGDWHMPVGRDARVLQVLDIVKRELPTGPAVARLAAAVGLSPGRLTHLWGEQVGLPLRRYILWLRLRHVVACIGMGQSLTDAAHEAGFADSAHLSRTFRAMFGLPLSMLFGGTTEVRLFLKLPQELSGPHAPYDRPRWESVARALRRGAGQHGPALD